MVMWREREIKLTAVYKSDVRRIKKKDDDLEEGGVAL